MQIKQGSAAYQELVCISVPYLGSSTDRIIYRQVQSHLHKSPQELRYSDIWNLIDWISVAASLLIEDEAIISSYNSELQLLAASKT